MEININFIQKIHVVMVYYILCKKKYNVAKGCHAPITQQQQKSENLPRQTPDFYIKLYKLHFNCCLFICRLLCIKKFRFN